MASFSYSMRYILASACLTGALTFTLPAHAQYNDNRALMDRLDRMERDMSTMQRQAARGSADRSTSSVNEPVDAPIAAQTEVRLSAMEEELRNLRGKTEENSFQLKRLSDNFDKLQKDTDFRFNELSQGSHTSPTPASSTSPNSISPPPAKEGDKAAGATSAGDGVLHLPKDSAASGAPEQPRDLYNNAFRLLNQTNYDDAAKGFKSFTEKYPKDPLIGNAYYWLGETFYIKRDYVKAADSFRAGFEALPNGPKAADNLLKLGMTLSALKRDKDACTVLDQLLARFKNSSTAVLKKAETERNRIGCK